MTRWITYLLMLFIIALGILSTQNLKFEFDPAAFTFFNSEVEAQFKSHQSKFEQDDKGITVLFKLENGFKDRHDFNKLREAVNGLEQIHDSLSVYSISTLKVPVNNGFFIENIDFLPLNDAVKFENKYSRLNEFMDITEKFLSPDHEYSAVYIGNVGVVKYDLLILKIKSILNESEFSTSYFILGEQEVNIEEAKKLEKETTMLIIISCLTLFLSFWFLVRHLESLINTIVLVLFNVCATILFAYYCDYTITILTVSIPCIVAILSFSDMMHIYYHYHLNKDDSSKIKRKVFNAIGVPLFLTSLTNLLGFLVFFIFADNVQIFQLSMMATFGIFFSYLSARFLIPLIITVNFKPLPQKNIAIFQKYNARLVSYAEKNRNVSFVAFSILLLFLVFHTFTNTKIDSYYYDKSEEGKSMSPIEIYDNNFQGIRDVEVVIHSNEPYKIGKEQSQLIDTIENYLINTYRCKSVFSVNTVLKRYNRFNKQGRASAYRMPKVFSEKLQNDFEKYKSELGIEKIIAKDRSSTRIVGSLEDIGSYEGAQRNHKLKEFLKSLGTENTIEIYGQSYLFDTGIFQITKYILWSIFVCLILISVFFAMFMKSVKTGVFMFLVNLAPVLSGIFFLDLFGLSLNPQNVLMLSVLLGVALDDSIYILWHIHKHKQSPEKSAFPLFATSIILAVAFLGFSFSQYTYLAVMGFSLFFNLIFAYFVDVLLLPQVIKSKKKIDA